MLTCGPNNLNEKKSSIVKKDLEDITCSVCMEYPHNAVLLLCSSHNKGCRPYMCGTSSQYSNCLDQYKNAYTKAESFPLDKYGSELACPLCRGQVKGWTVVESARDYLNAKKRTCMHDNCSFVGVYKELKKHVRSEHPSVNPREVDPDQEQKWRRLERDRERSDVISTITSSMPGSVVFGDYVIERNPNEEDFDTGLETGLDSNFVNMLLFFHAFGPGGNTGGFGGMRRHDVNDDEDDDDEDGGIGNDGNGMSLVNRLRRQGRVILGRSGRRRRHRVVNRDQT